MNIVVCIKQVPDTTEIKIDPVKNTLIRTGVPSIMNPFDKNALETGLQLKDRYGGKVTVISMGRLRRRQCSGKRWPWERMRRISLPTAPLAVPIRMLPVIFCLRRLRCWAGLM